MIFLERAQCILSQSNLSQNFCTEAISMACCLVNRSPSTDIKIKTLIEVWSDISIDYYVLKIFGCSGYVYVNDRKLGKRIQKCIFLAYQYG